jgi:hypothetical protein
MKRAIVVSLLILALVSLACSIGGLVGGAATETPVPPPQLPSATSTSRPLQAAASPTREVISSTTEAPTQAPTQAQQQGQPTQPSTTGYFRDEFDSDTGIWQYVTITGNSQEQCVGPSLIDGTVRWKCPTGEETQMRVYTTDYTYEDVVVQAEVENFGTNKNGISLLCRVSDAGWYEFRIASGGTYEIYRFDWALKNAGQNPYIYITNGASALLHTGAKTNSFAMDCSGSDFNFYINSSLVDVTIPNARKAEFQRYSSGGVGFGMMNFGDSPALADIAFNWFETLAP